MSLQDRLERLEKFMEENGPVEKKKKPFKIPFSKRVGNAQRKKNYVTIMGIGENGAIDFQKEQIQDQTIMYDKIPRLATPKHILHWKKNPVIIIPSWSVNPLSPQKEHEKSLNDGSNTKGYRLLLHRAETESATPKKKLAGGMGLILGIGLAVIIAYALFTGGTG